MSSTPDPRLDLAYALRTPEDNRKLYADWARSYDEDFARAMHYQLPGEVAKAYVAAGGGAPVLDIGAGTGLVGECLAALGVTPVDGVDISPEMLVRADEKRVYRRLFAGDVSDRLDLDDASYAGIVSAGTFTLGHLGPGALDEVLRIAAPGALVVLSISRAHYDNACFDARLPTLADRATQLRLQEVPIYGEHARGDHAADVALILVLRRL